jgi:hypothetical protein
MSEESEPAAEEGLFPVDGKWFEIGFYVVLLGWLLYLLLETSSYDDFEDYFFPFLLGVPLAFAILVHLATLRYPWIVERLLPDEEQSAVQAEMEERVEELDLDAGPARSAAERDRWEIYMIVWVALLAAMMYYVGMGWTIVVYTLALTYFLTRDVKKSVLVTLVVIVFIWVLFLQLLEMIIWRGTLGLPDPLVYISRLF